MFERMSLHCVIRKITLLLVVSCLFTASVASAGDASIAIATKPSKSTFQLFDQKGTLIKKGVTPFVGKLPAGMYRLVLSHPLCHKEARSFRLSSGDTKVLQMELMRKQMQPKTAPASRHPGKTHVPPRKTPQKITQKAPQRKIRVPWLPLVLGAGFLTAGGVFFGVSQLHFAWSRDKTQTQRVAYKNFTDAQSFQSTSMFLSLAGGVALVISGFLFLKQPPPRTKGPSEQYKRIPIIGRYVPGMRESEQTELLGSW